MKLGAMVTRVSVVKIADFVKARAHGSDPYLYEIIYDGKIYEWDT